MYEWTSFYVLSLNYMYISQLNKVQLYWSLSTFVISVKNQYSKFELFAIIQLSLVLEFGQESSSSLSNLSKDEVMKVVTQMATA